MANWTALAPPDRTGPKPLAQGLDISQGETSKTDKLARRLGLGMNFKGWRMICLPVDLNTLNVLWEHMSVGSFVFRK
jgi:hypothetical protein